MIGSKFGNWIVVDDSVANRANGYKLLCKCVCGTEGMVQKKYLVSGKSKSCGCHGIYAGLVIEGKEIISVDSCKDVTFRCEHGVIFKTRVNKGNIRAKNCPCDRRLGALRVHGETHKTKEYECWRHLRQRCNNTRNSAYKYYGGRGIKVCDRWNDFRNFLTDMGRKPAGMTIDRIDINGNYEPSNCRWADNKTQQRNKRIHKRTLKGIRVTMTEVAEELGVNKSMIYNRVYGKWMSLDEAVNDIKQKQEMSK